MFEPQEFFDLTDFDHREIFLEDQPVWTVLDRLPEYFNNFFQKPWPLANINGQIQKTLVIHNDDVHDNIEVKPIGPKGSIEVFRKGKILEDAAVIMAGACLFDDRIILQVR